MKKRGKISGLKGLVLILYSFFILVSLLALAYAALWTTNNQSNFDQGTYNNTEFNTTAVMLKYWNDTEQELPNNGITDEWGVNMTGNVLLMHMNDKVEDSSGNGHHGIAQGDTYTQADSGGPALGREGVFDGLNPTVFVGDENDFDFGTNNFSISMWVNVSSGISITDGESRFLQKGTSAAYSLAIRNTGVYYVNIGVAGKTLWANSGYDYRDSLWHHVVVVRNGDNASFFIDGTLDNSNLGFAAEVASATDDNLWIGEPDEFGSDNGFEGLMDEVAIYNKSLNSTEISNLYNSGNGYEHIGNESGLVGVWHMNEDSWQIQDTSGNGNHGNASDGVSYNENGKLNSALEFDGVDDYVEVDSPTFNDTMYVGSVTFWGKLKGNTAAGDMFFWSFTDDSSNNNPDRWFYYVQTVDKIEVVMDNAEGYVIGYTPAENLSNWNHYAVSWNPTNVSLYINGEHKDTQPYTLSSLASMDELLISAYRRSGGPSDFLNGSIDELSIWNRSLSADEISEIYQRQKGHYGGGNTGNYTSEIFDASANSLWNNISWTSNAIGELPDNQEVEDQKGGANMTGNVLLMHMNEQSVNSAPGGTDVEDTSGNGNHGNESGGVTFNAAGKLNSALEFDGVDDYVEVNTNDAFNINDGNFTVATWVKPESWAHDSGIQQRIVDKSNNANDGWMLISRDTARFEFVVWDGNDGAFEIASSSTGLSANKWYHVVGVKEGTTIKIYVDATLEPTTDDVTTTTDNAAVLTIGRRQGASAGHWNGSIDEVAIWNRTLSAQEIKDIYERGALKFNLTARSCDDAACSGETWTDVNDTSPQNLSAYGISDNQYFQYKYDFETDDSTYTPELYNVSIYSTILNVAPNTPILNAPSNNSNFSVSYVLLNTTVTDPDGDNMTVYFFGNGSIINTTSNVANGSDVTYNWTGLGDGNYNWSVTAGDGTANTSSSIYFFTIDMTAPTISSAYSNISTAIPNEYVRVNCTATDSGVGLDTILIEADKPISVNQNYSTSLLSGNTYYADIQLTESGTWSFNCWANDTLNNLANLTDGNVVVNTAPTVTLNQPTNNSYTNVANSLLNATVYDNDLDNMTVWFYGDEALINTTYNQTNGTTITYNWTSLSEGPHNWTVKAGDSIDNSTIEYYLFTVDLTNSSIALNAPIDNFNTSSTTINFNWTAIDNIDTSLLCSLIIDGTVNASNIASPNGTATNYTVTGLNQGTHQWNVICQDNATNTNTSLTRSLYIDLTPPTSNFPSDASHKQGSSTTIGWTLTDEYAPGYYYVERNGTVQNSTTAWTNGTSLDIWVNTSTLGNWNYTIFFNDSVGNSASDEVIIIIVPNNIPTVNLNQPTNNSYTTINSALLNATVYDNDLDNMTVWFYGDEALINTTYNQTNGTTITYNWTGLSESLHNWTVKANDGIDNSIIEYYLFTVDLTNPLIDLVSPTTATGNYSQNYILANVTASDTNLGTITINLYNTTGLVQQNTSSSSPLYVNFSSLSDGSYYLNATVNDSSRRMNYTETRVIILDTTSPVISNVQNTSIITSSALITWDTDESANSTVNYGNTTSLGLNETNSSYVSSHSIPLTNLADNTTYYYNVTSCDSLNNCNTTGLYNFTTLLQIIYSVNLTQPANQTINTEMNATYTITVTNNGTVADNYTLSVNNTDNADTAALNQTSITNLGAGSSLGVTLTAGDSSIGNYSVEVTANSDVNSSSTYTVSITTQIISGPLISATAINPYAVSNGSGVSLYISASNANATWASIIKPDSNQENLTLTNNANTTFSNTSLIGRYNVTFYANDSLGTYVTEEDYLESFLPLIFNVTTIDHNRTGINSTWISYYRNGDVATNSSENGTIIIDQLPETILNLEFKAYENRLQVYLRDINVSEDNGESFGMDNPSPASGYLRTYGINNTYNFTNATLKIYYGDLSVHESYLKLYKCNNWNFTGQSCLGTWTDVTSQATQDTTNNYFNYLTTSFSGFSIKDTYTAPQAPSGGGGGGGSCNYRWNCAKWSNCINGKQTRTCENIGTCTDYYKTPTTKQDCTSTTTTLVSSTEPASTSTTTTTQIDETHLEEKALFDIKVELKNDELTEKEALTFYLDLINLGVPGKLDMQITYNILDLENNVVYEETETKTVEGESLFNKKLNTTNLGQGEYKLLVKASYDKKEAVSENSFQIKKGHPFRILQSWWIIIGAVSLSIIILAGAVYLIKRKRRIFNF